MARFALTLCSAHILSCILAPAAHSQSQSAKECVQFVPNPNATETQFLGWLKNTCDMPIGVVHDFGLNPDGTPKQEPWCNARLSSQAYLHGADLLDPGESLGIGWALKGRAKKVYWAACTVDTSKNNAVYFIQEEPAFLFYPSCDYDCQ